MKFFLLVCMVFSFGFASVDINSADAAAFSSLKGVGEKKAEAIVTYRNIHGCFKNVDELTNVKGIGAKTVAENKKELTVGACKK